MKSAENKQLTDQQVQTKHPAAEPDLSTASAVAQKKSNNTGLPNQLKSGVESLSGYSMDDVKVHYNSPKPAQLQAHAYAQGNQIHIGPGQERHLPHEAWHVVQQKQGRVKPTTQLRSKVNINDDAGLEREADVMGAKALQFHAANQNHELEPQRTPSALKTGATGATTLPVQRRTIILGRNSDDYATMKVLATLSSPGTIQTLDELDGDIGDDETIYIVGHGYPGGMWADGHSGSVDFDDLAGGILSVLPDDWEGEIVALTCRAAVDADGDDDSSSAVQKLQDAMKVFNDGLDSMGIESITIKGGKGFSYGSETEGAKDQTAILKPGLEMFYSGNYNANDMAGKLTLPGSGKRAPQSVRRRQIGTHQGVNFLNPKDSKEAAKAWVYVRDLIEADMVAEVKEASKDGNNTVGGRSVEDTLAALDDNGTWKNLLTEQEREFTFYKMFMPSDEAFESLTHQTS